MVTEPLVVEFHERDRAAVVRRMEAMAAASQGWINFTPGLDVDFPPPQRGALSSLFTAKGPDVPLATWSPGNGRKEPPTVGLQHAQGPRVLAQLAEEGIVLPDGWRTLQDHPKRGLVCALPVVTDAPSLDRTLDWLLHAAGRLCPIPRTGEWRALCYQAI